MIKLSLIIPYHNEPEEGLNRLIYTILSQINVDFKEIEIVVSNNSEDPITPSFIPEHQYPDDLTVSYYLAPIKNLSGPSRQNGIINCKGKYFSLLDSDDTLSDVLALHDMLETVDKNPSYDIYYFKEYQEFPEISSEEITAWFEVASPDVTIHGKIYRKDFIMDNNIEHIKDIRFSEDTLFNLNCKINNPSIFYSDRCVYLTHFNPDSASNSDYSFFVKEASFCHCKGVEELAEIYKDKGTAVLNILIDSLLNFQERFEQYIDLGPAVKITIYNISKIIKDIDINKIEHKELIKYLGI